MIEHLFNLKFAAKDLERQAKRCEKSEKEEKVKLKKVRINFVLKEKLGSMLGSSYRLLNRQVLIDQKSFVSRKHFYLKELLAM